MVTQRPASLSIMWSDYAADNPNRPREADQHAIPGLAPDAVPGLDPMELMVEGQHFLVTRRAESPGTYDFDWISHPESYGFTLAAGDEWRPDHDELAEQIRSFLAEIDPDTGYLPD